MFQTPKQIETFTFEDLVGRVIEVQSFQDGNLELIIAKDIKTGEVFVLKQITHPIEDVCVAES